MARASCRIFRGARKFLDNVVRASIDSQRLVVFRFTPSAVQPFFAVSFLPTRDNSAPCCDSIARFFRINLTAGINQHASSSVIPEESSDIYTLKDPSIRQPRKTHELPLMAFLSYKIGVDLSTTSLTSLLYQGNALKVRFCLNYTNRYPFRSRVLADSELADSSMQSWNSEWYKYCLSKYVLLFLFDTDR